MKPIVLDNGSCFTKIGYGGEKNPRSIYPFGDSLEKDYLVGEEVENYHLPSRKKFPIERGEIINWRDIEKVWRHGFKKIGESPCGSTVLCTEHSKNAKNNREKTTWTFFDQLSVDMFYLHNQGSLALFATGRTDGVVVDSGGGLTQIIPVMDGEILNDHVRHVRIGGEDVTSEVTKKLFDMKNPGVRTLAEGRTFKEQECYVAISYENEVLAYEKKGKSFPYGVMYFWDSYCHLFQLFPVELANVIFHYHHLPVKFEYELLDGTKVAFGKERMYYPEFFFQPKLFYSDTDYKGVHEELFGVVEGFEDEDTKRILKKNIVIAGGNSNAFGFKERFRLELENLSKGKKYETKLNDCMDYSQLSFIGGSIMSSLDSFKQQWIEKWEYDDAGATIVHRKCYS